jgi:hypothetical protein
VTDAKVEKRHREAASRACGNDSCCMTNSMRDSLSRYVATGDDPNSYWLSEHAVAQAIANTESSTFDACVKAMERAWELRCGDYEPWPEDSDDTASHVFQTLREAVLGVELDARPRGEVCNVEV